MNEKDFIEQEVAKLSKTGVLGRSRSYVRLLQYLAASSINGLVPKELEIASEVFGKGSDFNPNQDSLVRVYVHNLRQKLENYYAREDGSFRLEIPRGEYRLKVVSTEVPASPKVASAHIPPIWIAIVVVLLGINAAVMALRGGSSFSEGTVYDQVANTAVWHSFMDDDLPFLIVVGDYYIFAELDQFGNVGRLVRDFEINSADDLEDQFVYEPELMETYLDLDLNYLPDATASALKDALRIIYRSEKPVKTTPMSELSVADLRDNHIIYIGYISALDTLEEFVFASSGLRVGDTYDELLVLSSGQSFISGAGIPRDDRRNYRDYGLLSTFPGPGDNQVMVIAGTRDEGMMHTAQAVATLSSVTALQEQFPALEMSDPPAFEALFEVTGFDRTNLDAVTVYGAELDSGTIWRRALP